MSRLAAGAVAFREQQGRDGATSKQEGWTWRREGAERAAGIRSAGTWKDKRKAKEWQCPTKNEGKFWAGGARTRWAGEQQDLGGQAERTRAQTPRAGGKKMINLSKCCQFNHCSWPR